MKLILKTLSKLNAKCSLNIWGTIVVSFVIVILLFSRFLLNREERASIAIQSTQRIEVSVANGKVVNGYPEHEQSKTKDIAVIQTPQIPAEPTDNASTNFPVRNTGPKPVVIIIIKELGLNPSFTYEALNLPKEINMGFSPYSPRLVELVSESKALGHELILNIPIETKEGQADASARYTLLTTNPDTDNIKILEKLLGLAEGFNALYSDDNEVFTNSADKLKIILEVLKRGNKHFIYGAGYKNHSTIQDLNALNYSLLISDLELDDNVSVDAINAKFVAMEKIANEKGYVVAMAHAYPITINILQTWLQKAEEKGFVVSPLSVLLGKTIK